MKQSYGSITIDDRSWETGAAIAKSYTIRSGTWFSRAIESGTVGQVLAFATGLGDGGIIKLKVIPVMAEYEA